MVRGSDQGEEEWRLQAACRGLGPDLFFPAHGETRAEKTVREAEAVKLCDSCPVEMECRLYGVTTGERDGVWGGLREDELPAARRRLRA
jgi:WhiB family redox-sensing transcriptional regulator